MLGTNYNQVEDFLIDVSRGSIKNFSNIHKFGKNDDVDTGSFEDVWEYGGTYTYQSSASVHYISSSDASDTEEITVIGLDANYDMQEINVTLAGQTKTQIGTGETFIRVFRSYNNNGADLVGSVYVYEDDTVTAGVPDTATKIKATINNGNNQTLMAIYTVPADHTGYLMNVSASLSKKKDGISNVQLWTREQSKVFRLRDIFLLGSAGSSFVQKSFSPPIKIEEKTDIRVAADSSVSDNGISASFDLVLIKNGA